MHNLNHGSPYEKKKKLLKSHCDSTSLINSNYTPSSKKKKKKLFFFLLFHSKKLKENRQI